MPIAAHLSLPGEGLSPGSVPPASRQAVLPFSLFSRGHLLHGGHAVVRIEEGDEGWRPVYIVLLAGGLELGWSEPLGQLVNARHRLLVGDVGFMGVRLGDFRRSFSAEASRGWDGGPRILSLEARDRLVNLDEAGLLHLLSDDDLVQIASLVPLSAS